jgi:hypothetical protein
VGIRGDHPKAEYVLATDSEPVPRGKGEKHPDEGSEIVPETVCLQTVEALWNLIIQRVTACLLHNESATYVLLHG